MSLIKKARQLLRQPYPFYFEGRTLWKLITILALMGVAFQYFFRPFNLYLPEHKMSLFAIDIIHTAVALAMVLLAATILKFFPDYTQFWTVGKEFLFLALLLLAIGVGQFLIRDVIYDNPYNWSWGYFFEELRNTFLVGILFISILIPLNFTRLESSYKRKASYLDSLNSSLQESLPLSIKTQLKQDNFVLDVKEFIFAKAEGNYVELHLNSPHGPQKLVKRISLKQLEKQLLPVPYIVRTHRSFLVNINYIHAINGNAQGYTLDLRDCNEQISVSRKMIPEFEKKLNAA